MTTTLNINRLDHLLTLFGMSREELLARLNIKRKKVLNEDDVFGEEIKISLLKKIDEIFTKGLGYYSDPKNPLKSKEESIFFRKDNFNAELNLGAKQIVNKFEEEKISFSILAKLSDFNIKRLVPVFKIANDPKEVAETIRQVLYPNYAKRKRDFLKAFIEKLAENNILVFEFVETHNKKEKANINGFYLSPNVIVLKRNQKSIKREIFTLAHELGHYLINEEEIDDNIDNVSEPAVTQQHPLSRIERWCNDFAYYFLIGSYEQEIAALGPATPGNDYHRDQLEKLSNLTHLSTISLFTRLLLINKISPINYKKVTDGILAEIKDWEEKEKLRLEKEKEKAIQEGRKPMGAVAQPIISPLFLQTLQSALYNGLINEAEFCKRLGVKADKISKYL